MPFDPVYVGLLALALLLAGVFAGVLAGLLGVGGGIVIVPVLFQMLEFVGVGEEARMHVAVGTSLACIVPTSIMSIRAHLKRDAVDKDLLRSWAPAVAVGVVAGTAVAGLVRGPVLTGVFAAMAMLVAAHMAFSKESLRLADHPPTGWAKNLVAGLIGTISSMMGIGGGSLTVPVLVLSSYPIRRAVATSAAIGLVIAVPGAIGFVLNGLGMPERPPFTIGNVSLLGLVLIAPASTLAAPLGARIAHSIDPRHLRKAFAVFLAVTSVRMIYGLLT